MRDYRVYSTILCMGLSCVQDYPVYRTILCLGLSCVRIMQNVCLVFVHVRISRSHSGTDFVLVLGRYKKYGFGHFVGTE